MIINYEKEICEILLSKYENRYKKSSMFAQKISLKFNENGYKKYVENNAYKYKAEIDEAVENLAKKEFISVMYYPAREDIKEVILINENIANIYEFLEKKSIDDQYLEMFQKLLTIKSEVSVKFVNALNIRKLAKKSIQRFIDTASDCTDAVVAIGAIQELKTDVFIRNLSARVFADSKKIENMELKIVEIYNMSYDTTFTVEEFFLANGVLKNPNYIHVKGKGLIKVNNQIIDLDKLGTTFSISSEGIDNIKFLEIENNLITTVENLTTFNCYNESGLIIYLGGFSNHSKVRLIKNIGQDIVNAQFMHFGDIDLGGFLILKHLRENTLLKIEPLNMDVITLKKNMAYTKKPNENYIAKLNTLLVMSSLLDCKDTIKYMIENQVILEQETIEYCR